MATLESQQVFGTAANTYTMSGITSGLSRSRQSGPLDVVTTDAAGNLASDGGLLFKEISKLGGGIAIAMSLQNPDLVAGERFGLAGNLGIWDGNVAMGFTGMGVLGHNFMGAGERWALSGGVGFTVREESFGGRSSQNSVGGRAGLQVTW
jgi:trimeric autotransporter adhesin